MKYQLFAAAMLCAIALPCAAQTLPKPAVEAFGALPLVDGPSVSSDGKYLALIQVRNGRPVAAVWALPELRLLCVVPFDKGFITGVRWANDHRLLVTLNMNARAWHDSVNPWYRTVAIDADGKNPVLLFANNQSTRDINYSASRIDDLAPDDPDHVYMPLYSPGFDDASLTLFRVDLRNGSAQVVERGNTHTRDWVMDGQGHTVARLDQTKRPLTDHVLVHSSEDEWKEIASTEASDGHGFSIEGLTLDGKSLVVAAVNDTWNTFGLAAMSLKDGSASDMYFDPNYDSGALIDPWSMRVIGTSITRHLSKDTYFEPALTAMQKQLEGWFPGTSAHALSWDRSRRTVVISVDGPVMPPTYYIADMQTLQVTRLARAYPNLQTSDLGQMQVYSYKARDGLDIPAYLTLPPGKEAKNLPVVILPHGGPMSRDDMSFNWETQFLANRGYAVLRPNFRGSSGYGMRFTEAGYGQWGLKMQDDITDGVKKLIADGIADPKRICIVGGSYGGYAALAGAAFTPDLYACAASWAGVTDLRLFLSTRSQDFGNDSAMISSWTHFVGDRWDDSEKLDAASPSENADKIKCPVLLMHGKDDATVRIDQSERMDRALRRKGKKVTFITIEKETHYMQSMETRVRWLTELEKFLKENIGN